MKNHSMFPYRRSGGKKRGKGGPGPRHPHPHVHPREGRRLPGSAAELLPLLQPTTKALAQMLAGNTRMSGQLVHARNILSQAQRLVDERAVDRMPPVHREEFLEQLARLKLTLADAEEAGLGQDAQPVPDARPAARIEPDRLRDVARRLATIAPAEAGPQPVAPVPEPEEVEEAEEPPAPDAPGEAPASSGRGGERLRLRMASGQDGPVPVRVRERTRLKPLKPAAGD